MQLTKRKPATVGEILVEEFLTPLNLTQGELAEAMSVPRKHVNELCNDRRAVTAPNLVLRRTGDDELERVAADDWRVSKRAARRHL